MHISSAPLFQFAIIETLTSSIVDAYPAYLWRHRTLFLAGTCLILLLLGIPFVTRVSKNIITLISFVHWCFKCSDNYEKNVFCSFNCLILYNSIYIYRIKQYCNIEICEALGQYHLTKGFINTIMPRKKCFILFIIPKVFTFFFL